MIYRFDEYELDTALNLLRGHGEEIGLEPRAYSLLCFLVENHDRMVSKDELVEHVWSGRFITDDAISTAVKAVRKALGDDGAKQRAIKTLRGRGFRFVAPVSIGTPASAQPEPEQHEEGGRPSIAILPFRLVGQSEPYGPIADAIPAELITSLSRLRWLRVFARGSCFRFRDEVVDLGAIRSALGASYCLSGIVEILGQTIGITVELTDTRSKSVVWSDRITGKPDQIYEMRADIASSVVTALELHIPLNEAENARLRSPLGLDAWGLYHLGLQHMYRFNKTDTAAAAEYLERATARDPTFSRAYAARSFVSFQNAFLNYTRDGEAEMQDARRFAERSVELDPLDPLGNFTLARAHWLEGDPEGGLGWLDRAITYSPNFAHGLYARAWTDVIAGRSSDALNHIRTAIDLSPLDPFLYAMQSTRALAYLTDGDTSRAALWAEHGARGPGAHYLIAMIAVSAHQLNGDESRASAWAEHVRAVRPDATLGSFFKAFPFSNTAFRTSLSEALGAAGFRD